MQTVRNSQLKAYVTIADSIKSIAKIDVCIVEAEDISDAAWEVLEPTIRAPKSEIWVIWNPKHKGSATDKRFQN